MKSNKAKFHYFRRLLRFGEKRKKIPANSPNRSVRTHILVSGQCFFITLKKVRVRSNSEWYAMSMLIMFLSLLAANKEYFVSLCISIFVCLPLYLILLKKLGISEFDDTTEPTNKIDLPPVTPKPVPKKPKKPPALKKRKSNKNITKCQNQENINAQMEDRAKDSKDCSSEDKGRGKIKRNRNHSPASSKSVAKVYKEPLAVKYYAPLPLFLKLDIPAYEIYHKFFPYILHIEQLKENGFPLESMTNPGKAELYHHPRMPYSGNSNVRMCSRCGEEFTISEDGKYSSKTVCHYHTGKRLPLGDIHNAGAYSCCGNPYSSGGCEVGKRHVCAFSSLENVEFVKTREKRHCPPYCIYALDCEMCYTMQGLEVTRISIVGADGLTVYDTFVVPDNPIIDYNTKFSGITANHLKDVKTTLADVQAYLLKLLTANTILVGHGLENDLKALHLIHPLIVDTSVVFSENRGKPRKLPLKTLASTYLQRTIQQGQHGHDSVEDARTCIELMLWKIQRENPPSQQTAYIPVPTLPSAQQWQRPLSINHVNVVMPYGTLSYWVPPVGSPCELY